MDTVRPAKSLDQFSAMQCLMSLQNCSAGLRHGHGPIRAGPAARLSESLGFCRKLYNKPRRWSTRAPPVTAARRGPCPGPGLFETIDGVPRLELGKRWGGGGGLLSSVRSSCGNVGWGKAGAAHAAAEGPHALQHCLRIRPPSPAHSIQSLQPSPPPPPRSRLMTDHLLWCGPGGCCVGQHVQPGY